jgi:hypothetical protein
MWIAARLAASQLAIWTVWTLLKRLPEAESIVTSWRKFGGITEEIKLTALKRKVLGLPGS